MSFFVDGEADALRIRRMILHVVGAGDFEPQVEMENVEQEQFFLSRIKDIDASGLFTFDAGSQTKRTLSEIAGAEISFEEGAQRLARDFAGRHSGVSVDGALFMFELDGAQAGTRFYSLLKYDYREAIERTDGDGDGQSHLRRIVEAFVADKKAMQKSCLIRLSDDVVQDGVAAQDRMGRSPDLTDYFAAFLGVRRDRDDSELSRNLTDALRNVFIDRRDDLPNQDASAALRVAKDALGQRQRVDNAAVLEAVMVAAGNPDADDVVAAFESTVTRKLRSAKLTGVEFAPDPQVLRRAARKRIQTVEGVTIEYPSDLEGVRVRTEASADGGRTITIETARIEDQTVVRDRPR